MTRSLAGTQLVARFIGLKDRSVKPGKVLDLHGARLNVLSNVFPHSALGGEKE
jgi:hypothetical protein